MSRTYRRHLVSMYKFHGDFYDAKSVWEILDWHYAGKSSFQGAWFNGSHDLVFRKSRDNKPWYKPNKGFKQMNRRIERAKIRNAIQSEKEVLPIFKKSDVWKWT